MDLLLPLSYQLLCRFRLFSVNRQSLVTCNQSHSVVGGILSETIKWRLQRQNAASEPEMALSAIGHKNHQYRNWKNAEYLPDDNNEL